MKLLYTPLLFTAFLPAISQVNPIEAVSFLIQQAPIEQVYLLLVTQSNIRGVKSSAH